VNELKSQIGFLVGELFLDKIREKELSPKERIKYQKELVILKSQNYNAEVTLNPGIYNQDGSQQMPPQRDLEFENWLIQYYNNK
jgi:hypothetical protein